ncbi:MAG: DUF177 domain-containing protein [Peptococcaceae bacterium]|nr:DUF177 domain-containing protein [Peptococcaceae bacterium]
MRINISQLEGKTGQSLRVTEDKILSPINGAGGEVSFKNPLHFAVEVTNVGDGYWVEGRVSGKCILKCARCLDEFMAPLHASFTQKYLTEAKGKEASDEEVLDGDELDLEDKFRESILLALPMKALCREDCPGICPRCGANLKEGDCKCPRNDIDPRWAVLGDLLRDQQKGVD